MIRESSGPVTEPLHRTLTNAARRFKPGSWPNRTLHRASDYAWFWLVFKPRRKALRRGR